VQPSTQQVFKLCRLGGRYAARKPRLEDYGVTARHCGDEPGLIESAPNVLSPAPLDFATEK